MNDFMLLKNTPLICRAIRSMQEGAYDWARVQYDFKREPAIDEMIRNSARRQRILDEAVRRIMDAAGWSGVQMLDRFQSPRWRNWLTAAIRGEYQLLSFY